MVLTQFQKSILKTIRAHPGIRASKIASLLKFDRKAVNRELYSSLNQLCYQDSSYCWFLKEQKESQDSSASDYPDFSTDKLLEHICEYYLNCLSLEESNGVSAYQTSKYSLDYTELNSISLKTINPETKKLISKVTRSRNLTAHIGYPVLLEKFHSRRTNQDYYKVAPVFLFSVDLRGGSAEIASLPYINMEVIKHYSVKDINQQVYDLVELESELGLNAPDADIDLDELAARLQTLRTWEWKDDLNPDTITTDPSLSSLTDEGIYNRAIFIVSEKSPYTEGLESELSKLSKISEDEYRDTALYQWIHHEASESSLPEEDVPLLEVLPTNSEQEQAIRHAFHDKLTIVTGPPGTGKSQVVTNLLINAAWKKESTLFTSKNNKAVDVVETRVNSIGRQPIMLRIGGTQYAYHLAELISSLLSYQADQNDQEEYKFYLSQYEEKVEAYKNAKKKTATIIDLRNRTDHLEQKACSLRKDYEKCFNKISAEDTHNCERAFNKYQAAYRDWYETRHSIPGRIFWFLIGKEKTSILEKSLSSINTCLQKYGYTPPALDSASLTEDAHAKICKIVPQFLESVKIIGEYRSALQELLAEPQLENIDREILTIKSDLAEIAGKLWNKWLVARPLNMDSQCRSEMSDYVASIRLIGNVDISEYPSIRKQFKKLQQEMTQFLPCWAVTSLSAKGRIPFEPGIFDLVIIDEASQCDIASALPMLYRAKRAVIIGDPKQLSHISTISKKQDISLLQKYDLENQLSWSYSVSSLYNLASSLVNPNQIIKLRDHHRSYGDIIEFSNQEFYDGTLRVATNYDKLKFPKNVKPGIRWIDAKGKTVRPPSGSAYNEAEVRGIVDELKHLVLDNQYSGTIGVVTPFRAQAEKVNKAIEAIPELKKELAKNDFLADTVHKFQGDERDVMFFSPVISNGVSPGALEFLKSTGNLFNVAVTRARAVLIVVGNADYCSSCEVKYIKDFVSYVNQLATKKSKEVQVELEEYPTSHDYPKVANPEQVSDWERLLYTALYDQGIKTIPQYPVEKYKLDLAIVQGKRKLDIEVDGERYHRDWNGELCYRDQLRNQRLFELGWDVKRFWVYQIRDDLQSCIDEIKNWCEK
jgi:very-short-patch-repair endonuclease